jgi:hypothetical protein
MFEVLVVVSLAIVITYVLSESLSKTQKKFLKGKIGYEKVVAYLGKKLGRKGGRK